LFFFIHFIEQTACEDSQIEVDRISFRFALYINFFLCIKEIKILENRLDKILVERGLVKSRERAKELIQRHAVVVNGKVVNKPGKLISTNDEIVLTEKEIPWVSRGALKLIAALNHFNVTVSNKICLDLGASTGGFTEVLLAYGASLVYAVDVGHGQLDEKLRQDKRVVNLEKTHAKELNKSIIPHPPQVCVIDVSFISVVSVLPYVLPVLAPSANVIVLVKPQFEVGKKNLNKQGIVRDAKLYDHVLEKIKNYAKHLNLDCRNMIESPILGGDGNKEFLMNLVRFD
jgi:23S rRNA (cytidine1920-2'-O)/16S rRNA (cytidine1409-2'-O)-methyltransferase